MPALSPAIERAMAPATLLARSVFLLCMLAPWSLLWLDSSLLFPYETGKAWLFRGIVSIAFALLLVYRRLCCCSARSSASVALSDRVWRYTLLIFLIWTGVSNLLGIDPYRSFWSNYERMSGYLAYLYWAAYFVCLISVLNEPRSKWWLFNCLLVILLVGALGLLEPEKRAIATLGNPIYLGNLAVFGIFIAGFLFAGQWSDTTIKARLLQLFLLLVSVVLLLTLFKSASRGPMLALLAGVMLVAGRLLMIHVHSISRAAWVGIGIVVLLGGPILALNPDLLSKPGAVLRNSDYYALQRLGRISMHNQTTADRLQNWKIALDAGAEHPLSGWGQENYAMAYNLHYRAGVMDKAKIWFDRAHNAYLDVLVASGWPGLVLYILMVFMPMWLVYRHSEWRPAQQAFALGLLGAFAVKNGVGFDTFSSTLIWLSFNAVLWIRTAGEASVGSKCNSWPHALVYSGVAMFAAASAIYSLSIKPYRENQLFAGAINPPLAQQQNRVSHLLNVPPADLIYAQNAKLAVFDRLIRQKPGPENAVQTKAQQAGLFQQAGVLVSNELHRQPRNARIRYNGAMLLGYTGQYEAAIQMLKMLLKESPQRTVFWGKLAKLYAITGNKEAEKQARLQQQILNPKRRKK